MIVIKRKLQLIESIFGQVNRTASGKNVSILCPVCIANGKKTEKKKLSICLESGIYHCWVCETKGANIGKLAIKNNYLQKDASKELYSIYNNKKEETSNEVEKIINDQVLLPDDFSLLAISKDTNSAVSAKKYLYERNFSDDDFWRFKPGISNKYPFKNRIIFPSFDSNQNLNYFIARSYDSNEKKRYYNCSKSRKNIIFNEVFLDFKKTLILTEGIFDLVHCPYNSTCILGSWIDGGYLLFKKIIKNRTPVILCLDPDAKVKTQKIAKLLYEYCVDVKISEHKNNDFGDMTKKEVDYWINTAKRFDNVDRVSYLIKDIKSGSIF